MSMFLKAFMTMRPCKRLDMVEHNNVWSLFNISAPTVSCAGVDPMKTSGVGALALSA